MLRSLLESVNVNSHREREVSGESRIHEERAIFQRSFRLDLPHFSDNDHVDWIFKANQYFQYFQIPFHKKLMVVAHHMEGVT